MAKGKAEVGSPKWLANKMKAKGLQKLRWYCQMCNKQCRDENGFKCHRMTEGHQRQMALFSKTPDRFMDSFSRDFENSFMKLMRTRYCKTRVLANSVYQDVISDRSHVHMNATVWVTLNEFIHYLERSNRVKCEETAKGWYIEYVDPDAKRREEDQERKVKVEESAEEREAKRLARLVKDAESLGEFEKYQKDEEPTARLTNRHFGFSLGKASTGGSPSKFSLKSAKPTPTKNMFGDADDEFGGNLETSKSKPKRSVIDELMVKDN
eukprot:GHVP01070414.1.p1 GENE.GHVP01070414.1~~GHVP01070414.1.p1  ORF type:complete len:266 (-),score=57.87 GHVP01070414.1:146-943(-)